jgi:hypothetical protein
MEKSEDAEPTSLLFVLNNVNSSKGFTITPLVITEFMQRINYVLKLSSISYLDIGRWVTIKTSMNQAKFDALEQYNTSPLFYRRRTWGAGL